MLRKIAKGILHPARAANRIYGNAYLWNYNYARLRQPKAKGAVPQHDARVHTEVVRQLNSEGYDVHDYTLDIDDFRRYLRQANYSQFPGYYRGGKNRAVTNFTEKALEHYLAAKFLGLGPGDVYIDIANDESPAPKIYHALYGCKSYRQDLKFPPGLHGDAIGGSAASMPLPDGYATAMALHCSFEHFEGDADTCFIREANRVLADGGKLFILPLYLHTQYSIQTDPAVLPKGGIEFEPEATLYCARSWGNRHGRVYSVPQLTARIRPALGSLDLTVYVVQNEKAVDPSCYVKFIGVFEKTQSSRSRMP
ncbi:MAG: methyltransferase domain-containing protein [Terriglobia bacterium]